jgi:2-amino-4-hydroxy-6-hydroxymethyldihydropteridine diphosphokinase
VKPHHTAFISVGSNLGQKLENCREGICALTCGGTTRLIAQSFIYRTEPVDYKYQDWFVNCVVKIETRLDPLGLLDALKSIEREVGRTGDSIRFGPRVLDLDIILYDTLIMNTPELTIPHPRMHKRRFVLKPICDIDPHMKHPVFQQSMRFLLQQLDPKGQRITEYK